MIRCHRPAGDVHDIHEPTHGSGIYVTEVVVS